MNRNERTIQMKLRASIAATLFCLLAGSISAQEITEPEKGLFVSKNLLGQIDAASSKRLIVRSAQSLIGTLTIVAVDSPHVSVEYRKRAHTNSRGEALEFLNKIEITLEQIADGIRFDMRSPNPAPWDSKTESAGVEARIAVPIGFRVEVDAAFFDVTVTGPLTSLSIPSSLGRLTISDVTEMLDVTTANKRIDLSNIQGTMTATTSNATIEVRNMTTTHQATFRNDGGDIKVDGCVGSVNVRNSFGRIDLTNFTPRGESNFIRGNSGVVRIEIAEMKEGQLVVDNKLDDIELVLPDPLSAFLSLSVDEGGAIDAAGFPFVTDLVQHNRLNLNLGNGDVTISASIKGKGNIIVRQSGHEVSGR